MVDIKRQDITLSDWTKGISADEFAGGSYYYSEAISSGYNTKGFELGYGIDKTRINSRTNGYASALDSSVYGFMAFTRDGQIETEEFWNSSSTATGDGTGGGAIYAFDEGGTLDTGYVNGLRYGKYAFGIREGYLDVIDYRNVYDPYSEILSNTDLSDSTGWTFGTGWTATDDGAEHTEGETGTLTADISGASLTTSDYCRFAVRIKDWTKGSITATIGNNTETLSTRVDGWYVVNLRGKSVTTTLTITPTSNFDGIIQYVNLHKFDSTYINTYTLHGGKKEIRPALVWEGDLYIGGGNIIDIVSLTDWGVTYKEIIDSDYSLVAITQQAGNLILRATNGYDSRQYYWNGVDAVATECIEWKGLIIQGVTGTETLSYVLTTSGTTTGTVEGYEYRLYVVSGYQRNLIASKLYQQMSGDYLESEHYNANKKFDFNDVTTTQAMTIFLDSLFIPGCDGVYKYGSDIPGVRSAWTRPIRYDNQSTNIVTGQRGHFLGIGYRANNNNYIGSVDNRTYPTNGYLITESIYWDKLSTRKALEKIKIGYKTLPSTVGNIKVYAIVDDTYFWRFRPTATPTTRPSVGDVYEVANDTTAKVIDVDTTNGVITLVTVNDGGSLPGIANTSLSKVSGSGDDTITVGYNYDNMCLVKTIESDQQRYGSDLIFGKDFVNNYLPYWNKIQFVIELSSNNKFLSPEIYEISMVSDITDVVL